MPKIQKEQHIKNQSDGDMTHIHVELAGPFCSFFTEFPKVSQKTIVKLQFTSAVAKSLP